MSEEKKISRRDAMKGMAVAVGAVAVGSMMGAETAMAAGKCPGTTPKATLSYQDHPKGKDHCAVCANFIAPHCCKVVAGPVSSNGYCLAFTQKSA